jgi:hypothetical protein
MTRETIKRKWSDFKYTYKGVVGILSVIAGIILLVAPFINHLVYCFQTEKYLLLIAGALVPPVGWFHGLGQFFGWW